jgi:heme-degrading monooxygenase HmoA
MFIAMNRFRVKLGEEENFEVMWKERDTFLTEVPGFKEFQLLRGPTTDEHTLFASHSVWQSRQDFEKWTQSEAFRKAHAQAGAKRDIYLGPPNFEGFEVIQGI